jgi:hypothetical protein
MIKMTRLLLLVIVCVLSGCTKEDTTLSYAKLYNNSGVKIEVTLFSSGMPLNEYLVRLAPNDSIEVSTNEYMGKGKSNDPGFNNAYFSISDSVIVTFNDSFTITHYRDTPLVTAAKYYLPSHSRCLLNIKNWAHSSEETKHVATSRYQYAFTEQDYLDAKD